MPDPAHSRAWQIDTLIQTARTATPFQSEIGQAFISIPRNLDCHHLLPLHSPDFRDWLIQQFYSHHGILPRASAVRDVIQLLGAQTRFGDTPRVPVARRVASAQPDRTVLDLYNTAGEVVEITPHGWRVTRDLSIGFRAARSAGPLPHPESSYQAIPNLRALLDLTPEHFTHCMSWLTAALSPAGPYPILVVQGPGKSSVAALLRTLIDPGPAPFCPHPKSLRDVQSLASHNWIVALDEVDRLPATMLRQLIRLSTGEVFAVRDRPSDPEPFHLYLQRPIVLTTSAPLAPELAPWAVAIHAPVPVAASQELYPQILGALCDAAAAELANPVPRTVEQRPNAVAAAVSAFLQDRTEWTGSATELLLDLRALSPEIQWPQTPKGISQLLQRTPLGPIDFQSLRNHQGRRFLELSKKDASASTWSGSPTRSRLTAPASNDSSPAQQSGLTHPSRRTSGSRSLTTARSASSGPPGISCRPPPIPYR